MYDAQKLKSSYTLPSDCYTEANIYAFESTDIFSKSWQYACHTSALKNKGDTLSFTLHKNPVVVVNTGSKIRAFYNVCRHRAGPLTEGRGHQRFFQCKYHGWTYTLDGELIGTPNFGEAHEFDKSCFGLKEISCITWQNLIFINFSSNPDDHQNPFDSVSQRISPANFDHMTHAKTEHYDIKCNWKVYVDNYLEGYHIPFVHPELDQLLPTGEYKLELNQWWSLQHSPIRDNSGIYGLAEGTAFYFFIFPNIMLNFLPGRLQVNSVVPRGTDRCRVIFDYLYDQTMTADIESSLKNDIEYSDLVQKQDIDICLNIQKALKSIAYDKGRISPDQEKALWHFHEILRSRYRRLPST